MHCRLIVLALASGLFANEMDEFDFESDFYPTIPDKVWSVSLASGVPSDTASARFVSLVTARDFRLPWKAINLWSRLEFGLATYIIDNAPLYALEPAIDLGAYGEWSETDASVWMSHDLHNDLSNYGVNAQSLLRLAHWQGGRMMLGPTIDYAQSSSAQTYAGGLLKMEHTWDYYGFSHGPQFRAVGNADLTSSTTSPGKGNSTMNIWSSSYLDLSYKVNWGSLDRNWSVASNLGYAWTMGTLRTNMRQTETESTGGLWANLQVSRWW